MTDIINGINEYQSTNKDDLTPFIPYMIENGSMNDFAVILNRFEQLAQNEEFLKLVTQILDVLLDISSNETHHSKTN